MRGKTYIYRQHTKNKKKTATKLRFAIWRESRASGGPLRHPGRHVKTEIELFCVSTLNKNQQLRVRSKFCASHSSCFSKEKRTVLVPLKQLVVFNKRLVGIFLCFYSCRNIFEVLVFCLGSHATNLVEGPIKGDHQGSEAFNGAAPKCGKQKMHVGTPKISPLVRQTLCRQLVSQGRVGALPAVVLLQEC